MTAGKAEMDKEELTAWALASGWRMIGVHPSLTDPSAPKQAVVRLVLKATGVDLEIRTPMGKWQKVAGQAYVKIHPDPQSGLPMGMGLESITGLARLMQENRDRGAS